MTDILLLTPWQSCSTCGHGQAIACAVVTCYANLPFFSKAFIKNSTSLSGEYHLDIVEVEVEAF